MPATPFSMMPVPRASRRSAIHFSEGSEGNSLGPVFSESKYSQMTRESYSTLPSSSISVGILFSGLWAITSELSFVTATSTLMVSTRGASPVSCAAIIALRTKGDRDDQYRRIRGGDDIVLIYLGPLWRFCWDIRSGAHSRLSAKAVIAA